MKIKIRKTIMIRKYFRKINEFAKSKLNIYLMRPFPRSSTREAMKQFGKKEVICAEIGVFKGVNAKDILKRLNVSKIYLVDPYEVYEQEWAPASTLIDFPEAERIAKKELYKFDDKIVWVKKYSDDAVNDLPTCDYIYLDANHDYEFVKKDMENYWKKIKVGGILAGNDSQIFGVAKAVMEFCEKNNIKAINEGQDWAIIKM